MTLDLNLDRQRSAPLYQQIVEQIKDRISDGRLPAGSRLPTVRHLALDMGVTRLTVQNAYGTRQSEGWVDATVALAALQRFMPPGVTWTRPAGGFCVWLSLPSGGAFDDLQQSALRAGWAFAPGAAFLTGPTGQRHLRLAFGNQTPDTIRRGIEVLAGLIAARMEEESQRVYAMRDWTPLV